MLLFRKSENQIFLIFKVSNSNMPQFFFRKKTFLFVVRFLRYSGYLTNTSCVCQVSFFSVHLDNKQKNFVPKNNLWHVTIRDFKNQKNLVFWILTRVSARDYTVCLVTPCYHLIVQRPRGSQTWSEDHERLALHMAGDMFTYLSSIYNYCIRYDHIRYKNAVVWNI